MTQSTMNAPRDEAAREYAEILGRHATPRAGDGERLDSLLPLLGKDTDDVTLDLLIIAEARRLAGECDERKAIEAQIKEAQGQLEKVSNALAVVTDRRKTFDLQDRAAELARNKQELEAKLMRAIEACVDLASLRNKYPGLLGTLIPWKAEWGASSVAGGETPATHNARLELEKKRRLAAMTPERRAAERAFYSW